MLCCTKKKQTSPLAWILLATTLLASVGYFFMTDTRPGRRLWKQMKRTGRECADACDDLGNELRHAVSDMME